MAMGADYSFELISIETYAPQFIGHNKFFLGSVSLARLLLLFVSANLFHMPRLYVSVIQGLSINEILYVVICMIKLDF